MVYQPAMRDLGLDPLTALRPTPQRRHVGFGPGLVNERQATGVDPVPIFGPLRPPLGMGDAVIDPDQIEAYRKSLAESRT